MLETPFSLYLTVRKSLQKSFVIAPPENLVEVSEVAEVSKLNERVSFLEKANDELKQNYDAEVNNNEAHINQIKSLEVEIRQIKSQQKLVETEIEENVKLKVKATTEEKRVLQIKHEKMCAEIKIVKVENEDLKKNINSSNVALKPSRKELKDVIYKFEKKVEQLEEKIEDLLEYKRNKTAEERDLRSKLKKVDKKLKNMKENEASLNLEMMKRERIKYLTNNNILEIKTEADLEPESDFAEKDAKPEIKTGDVEVHSNVQSEEVAQTEPKHENSEVIEDSVETDTNSITEEILNFFHSEPPDSIDITILKLELIKEMFAKKDVNTSAFDDLITEAKKTKDVIEQTIGDYSHEDDDHLEEDYFDDDFPRHCYGDNDELMFEGLDY